MGVPVLSFPSLQRGPPAGKIANFFKVFWRWIHWLAHFLSFPMVYEMHIYTVEYTAKPESDCGCEWKQSLFGRESQKEPGYGIFHVNNTWGLWQPYKHDNLLFFICPQARTRPRLSTISPCVLLQAFGPWDIIPCVYHGFEAFQSVDGNLFHKWVEWFTNVLKSSLI